MATITDGTTTIDGVRVAASTSLAQSNDSLAHYPLGGGPPSITSRASRGLSGVIDYLCGTAELADAVYALHAAPAGPIALDTYDTSENLVTQPYPDVGGGVSGVQFVSGDGGTVTPNTQDSPSGDPFTGGTGPVTRYTWDTAGTSTAGLDLLRGAVIPITPGQYAAIVWQFRPGTGMDDLTLRAQAQWLNAGAGNGAENGTPVTAPFGHAAASVVGPAPANTTDVRADLDWAESRALSAGNWFDYVGHLVAIGTEDEARAAAELGYFDGGRRPAGYTSRWSGAENASTSSLSTRPALDLTYSLVGNSVSLPAWVDEGIWLVSVAGVVEVAP